MSTDLVVPACPACNGDRTSLASNGKIYCVDCNRVYPIFESYAGAAEYGIPAGEMMRKAA